MKIGQVVKFRKEILDIAKPNTPVGNVINDCLKKTHVPGGIVLVDRQFSIKSR